MSTLVLGLIELAARIAKWIVRRVLKWTLRRLVGWMRKRVGVFKDRWQQAYLQDNKRRMAWLTGRIERWTKAADWLEQHAMEQLREAAKHACDLPAFAKLPEVARCELLSSH